MDKETAKQEVNKIVRKFLAIPKSDLDKMPEEQIKFRFIEPLFEALGWEREDIEKEKEVIRPYYTTKELGKYSVNKENSLWVIYSDINVRKNINNYPNIKKHLDKFKKIITSDFAPYGLHRAREQKFFGSDKIISLRKTAKPFFTYTDFPCYVSQTYFVIKTEKIDMKTLTGILNSKLIHFWLEHKGKKQGNLLQVDKEPLLNIPIKLPSEPPSQKNQRTC